MSDVAAERHYAYPLVTWGSTILGAVVALVTSLMLNLLGAAVGIAALAIGQSSAGATGGIVGIVWIALANLLSIGFGAWVAGRSTANPDHHGGTLQGIAVWAVTSFAVLFIAGSALAGLGGAATQLASGALATDAGASSAPGRSDTVSQAREAMRREPTPLHDDAAAAQDLAAKAATAAAAGAFGTVLAMILGLGAAVVGARAGARHPNWSDRPRYTFVERRH